MSNILPSTDRLHNPLTSYLQLSPSLQICLLSLSSSSKHLTKANRKRTDNLNPMTGIWDSKTSMGIMRRNTLVVLRVERPNNSGKARETKHSPLPSPTITPFLDLYLSPNSQIVYTSWISLWTFWRTHEKLHTLLLHSLLVLPPSRKLLTPSHSSSRWVLRSHLRLSRY